MAMTPPEPKRSRLGLIIAVVASAAVLVAAAVVVTLLVTDRGAQAPAADVPKIANIARPNVACTPVSDKKIGFGDDPNTYLWFGWLDGKQTELPYGQVLAQRIAGSHKIEDAWLCPPRSQW